MLRRIVRSPYVSLSLGLYLITCILPLGVVGVKAFSENPEGVSSFLLNQRRFVLLSRTIMMALGVAGGTVVIGALSALALRCVGKGIRRGLFCSIGKPD